MVAGMARAVPVAAFAGVIVVVLVAVGAGVGSLPASDPASALPAPMASTAMTNPPAPKTPRLRRRWRPKKARSAIELHPAIAPDPSPTAMLPQPKRFFSSRYCASGAWHHALAKVQPGE